MQVAAAALKDSISFSVKINNTGKYDGDEVVQVYIKYQPAERMPIKDNGNYTEESMPLSREPIQKTKNKPLRL
jgi:beta-glucosidase